MAIQSSSDVSIYVHKPCHRAEAISLAHYAYFKMEEEKKKKSVLMPYDHL